MDVLSYKSVGFVPRKLPIKYYRIYSFYYGFIAPSASPVMSCTAYSKLTR